MDHETAGKSSKSNVFMIPVSIIVAGVLVAGAVMYKPSGKPFFNAAATGAAQVAIAPTVDDDAVLGDVTAPVTVIIFGDYQCPFCEQQFTEVESKLRTEYVDTGKIKMAFRDFPLTNIHPSALPAAKAAQCAGVQGKYWQYHDALFAKQSELAKLDFTQLAETFNLDLKKFADCTNDPATAAEIAKDQQDGAAAGIEGTPGSFINGVFIAGAYPYETFKQVIDEELAKIAQ